MYVFFAIIIRIINYINSRGHNMNRIIVIGSSGSGKSTLSRKLSKSLDLPVYHLDALFWKPNWVMTEPDEQKHFVFL